MHCGLFNSVSSMLLLWDVSRWCHQDVAPGGAWCVRSQSQAEITEIYTQI